MTAIGQVGQVGHDPRLLPVARDGDADAGLAGTPLALLPLLLAMPFIYFPKVTENDTQPWVIGGAALALLFYWPRREPGPRTPVVAMSVLAVACLAIYYLRAPEIGFVIRFAGILGLFVALWNVAARGVPTAAIVWVVRATIVLWFVVGLYQTAAIRLGLPLEVFGRYNPGRSGVPSLTAEPSFYGSISVLQIMYLLTEKNRRDLPFIAIAVVSVLFSGSLLSFLLLVIPAFRLPLRVKVLAGIGGVALVLFGFNLLSSSFFVRIQDLNLATLGPDVLRSDVSTNYRAGHAWFTCAVNLWRELSYASTADFMFEYNGWASTTDLFLLHDSDIILPSGGELLFRGNLIGAALIALIIAAARRTAAARYDRVEKIAFVIACLLNPIAIANPFFVFYVQKRFR